MVKWLSVIGITAAAQSLKILSIPLDIKSIKEDKDTIEEAILEEHETWVDKTERFKDEFQTKIQEGLKKAKKQKLMVIIDDLDRCLPENAVKLLEAIKNFLATGNTLFVIAIDRRVMSEMITKKYQLHGEYGDEYLMKIIHYFYELPAQDSKQLISEILGQYDLNPSDQDIGYIAELLKSHAKETRKAKHYLFNFCNRLKLNNIDPIAQQGAVGMRYHFLASLLLIKYPQLFSQANTLKTLNDMRNMAHLRSTGRSDEIDRYKQIQAAYDFIKTEDRINIENLMLRTISDPGVSGTSDTIDTNKLLFAYGQIK